MSRLTASPFHKPSPFEFPRIPLSPPETLSDHLGSALPTTISVLGGVPVDPHVEAEPVHRSQSPETAGARFRRVSSLAYHSSGLRESRERAVQRSSRSFVVVIPPPTLLHEHGQLGNTLSLGPRHRLAQGMLMPLFPTLYGQLAAIAKEFNFPSITGLCLYFHFTENGITAMPRISDDSWQMIWSNVFDPSVPSLRVPIVGKLEFDIDTRHARWYSAWIASAHREHVDVPASVGFSTAAPSVAAHYREDSRATDLEINFDQLDSESVSPQSGRPSRHVPRKLSLVDRLDSSLRAVARATHQTSASSPERSASVQALSPIFQEEEPKTAKIVDLEKRVNTWRASASLTPSALAVKGQTSLEPANLPNSMALDDVADAEVEEELNLEDFTWSISSLGPNDWEDGSVASWDRLPSVHLERRMESSVCMTPSDCTSFGPSDYTLPSPVPSLERVLTPDIAHRMYEDCPPTPGTATSWGPPSEYPASPMSFSRASSVDIGDRAIFSPPPTPMTATSWGPASWPPSPSTPYYVHTPDAGQRAFDSDDLMLPGGAGWGWPYWQQHSLTTSTPWGQVWPYTLAGGSATSMPWGQVWPYSSASASTTAKPWGHSWPYSFATSQIPSSSVTSEYPIFNIYPSVATAEQSLGSCGYPDFNIYPSSGQQQSVQGLPPVSVHLACAYPSLKIYPSVYPHFDLYPAEPQPLVKKLAKANGYPNLEIYPPALRKRLPDVQVVKLAWNYPIFDLYPAVYPFTTPYPINNVVLTRRSFGYPTFAIYAPVKSLSSKPAIQSSVHYPFFDLYPAGKTEAATKNRSLAKELVKVSGYPDFDIYPSTQQKQLRDVHYPFFDLYPAVQSGATKSGAITVKTSGYPDFDIYPPVLRKRLPDVQVVKLVWNYPIFDLYPAVYPFATPYPVSNAVVLPRYSFGYPTFLLYPSVKQSSSSKSVMKPSVQYPFFDLYPAVHPKVAMKDRSLAKRLMKSSGYPDFDIYPPVLRKQLSEVQGKQHYPIFDLYPAVPSPTSNAGRSFGYPVFELYPSVKQLSSKPAMHYPFFDLYPAKNRSLAKGLVKASGYPDFEIYPTTLRKQVQDVHYPFFDLYPAVQPGTSKGRSSGYPDFDIYPTVLRKRLPEVQVLKLAWSYPIFDLYPGVYPHVTPYPTGDVHPPVLRERLPDVQVVKLAWSYPIFDLYPAVYPFLMPYPVPFRKVLLSSRGITAAPPKVNLVKRAMQPALKTVRSHKSLHFEVFPDGLVSTPSGTLPKTRGFTKKIAVTHRGHRSHRSLHDEVFPDGAVCTPSSETLSLNLEVRNFSRPPVSPRGARTPEPSRPIARSRSGSIATRPLSSHVGLPPRPNLRASTLEPVAPPSSAPPMRSTSLRNGPIAPQASSSDLDLSNPAPLRRAVSSATAMRGNRGLAPVAEASPLRSAPVGQRPVAPSISTPLAPRKRDSVVLQRIRAFEETEPHSSRLSLRTLKEFPMPPPPPPPTGGLPALPTVLPPRRTSSVTQSRP